MSEEITPVNWEECGDLAYALSETISDVSLTAATAMPTILAALEVVVATCVSAFAKDSASAANLASLFAAHLNERIDAPPLH
jgi:hypothetical protein